MTSTTASATPQPGRQQINALQNSPDYLELAHAADAAHATATRIENARGILALVLSAGALAATALPRFATAISLIGLAGSVAVWILGYPGKEHTERATKLQECFDVGLFGLPVNPDFKPFPQPEEIHRLARRYKGAPKTGWYVDVTELPRPYAVLLCQRENLQWDWPLRRAWASQLLTAAVGWLVLGLAIALIADWSTRALLLRWVGPSMPALTLAGTLIIANRKVARDKQQMALELDEKLNVLPAVTPGAALPAEAEESLMKHCRSYQDRIFRLRNHAERVPQHLYDRRKDDDEQTARTVAGRLRERLLGLNAR